MYTIAVDSTPVVVEDGLGMYAAGEGEPLLLMPYPHGFVVSPMIEGSLGVILQELGYQVISFDPPGTFNSTRRPLLTMAEMLACTEETLQHFGIQGAIDVIGHSMGGLCALGFALEHPERVRRLALFSSISGGSAIWRNGGLPLSLSWMDVDFWHSLIWGLRLMYGWGSLALHNKMLNLLYRHSYANKDLALEVEIAEADKSSPIPERDRFPREGLRIDYRERLPQVGVQTLVCVGRYDPQTPVACSEEIAAGIPNAGLVIFENSSHNLFEEEKDKFIDECKKFFQ